MYSSIVFLASGVERAGRSQMAIVAPMTGIVSRVLPIEGEVVEPNQPLFQIRLTHEDLVTAQRDFLRSAQELDVVNREISRLESVGEGVIAGRRVLEQSYLRDKTEAGLHAQRQGLLLHGVSEAQIDEILATRRLLQTMSRLKSIPGVMKATLRGRMLPFNRHTSIPIMIWEDCS